MKNTTVYNNNLLKDSFFNHFQIEMTKKQTVNSYHKKTLKNKKGKKNGAIIPLIIAATISPITQNNPEANINKSKIINSTFDSGGLEKGDVDMSNNKDTPAQEVRQKDLDNLEKIVNEKLKTSTTYVDGKFDTSTTYIDGKFNTLNTYIDGKFNTLNTRIDGKLDVLNQKIEGINSNIDKEADRRYKRTNSLIAIIGIVVPVVVQIIFKFIK